MARIAWAFIRRDFLISLSYRSAFLAQLLISVITVPMIWYLSRVFEGFRAPALADFGGDYFSFFLLGIAFQDYMTFSQSAFNTSIREHQLMGTLEIVMLSPPPLSGILLCSSLWGYIFTSLRFALYLLLGLFYGLNLSHANLLSLGLITLLSIVSFAALGILMASVTLIIKRGDAMTMLFAAVTAALGGVAYPVQILPLPLRWAAQLLPFTHALSGMRKSLLQGASLQSLRPELTALSGFALVLFPAGLLAFSLAVRRAKVVGSLGQY
jgi:ABC-2 type transport system permease protein